LNDFAALFKLPHEAPEAASDLITFIPESAMLKTAQEVPATTENVQTQKTFFVLFCCFCTLI
jgi:hypothetical protein